MTPNDIEVLLHYHVSPFPHPRSDAPAVQMAITYWVAADCLARKANSNFEYTTTARGKAMVDRLCATSLPVQHWK